MKILVLGAGGPAGVNTCRALYEAGHEVHAWDQVREHLIWTEPYAVAAPDASQESYDLAIPQPDSLVAHLAMAVAAESYPTPTFLPKPQTIALCQDKFECGLAWRRAGLRDDFISLIDSAAWVYETESFGYWLRARRGAGAKAALFAQSFLEANHWLSFWRAREPEIEFISEAFLPGRDYSWCGIYYKGYLCASFARERLEYLYPNLTPEGLTGTPTRARIVYSGDVNEMAEAAVFAVDEEPHGVFCVDLREDEDGTPRPTEINAGRFSTTVGLWSIYWHASNFVALAAELGMGGHSRLHEWEHLPEGLTLTRHIDCGHQFTMAKVLA